MCGTTKSQAVTHWLRPLAARFSSWKRRRTWKTTPASWLSGRRRTIAIPAPPLRQTQTNNDNMPPPLHCYQFTQCRCVIVIIPLLHQVAKRIDGLGYRVLPSFTAFYSVLPSFTWFYLVLPSFTEFYRALPSFTEFYWVLLGFIEFYRVLPSFMEFYPVLLSFIGLN